MSQSNHISKKKKTDVDSCDDTAAVSISETFTHRDLFHAAEYNDIEMINKCIAAGVKDEGDDDTSRGMSVLMYACGTNRLGSVEALLKTNTSKEYIDDVDQGGKSALMYAAEKGNTEIVSILIDAKANINLVDFRSHWSPLQFATSNGYRCLMQTLLNSKAPADRFVHNRECASYSTSPEGQTETVSVLINAKANVNSVDRFGMSALILASRYGRKGIVSALIDAKANVDLFDRSGKSALMTAMFYDHTETVFALINAKANVDLVDNIGQSSLHIATSKGYTEIVIALLNAIADVDFDLKEA